MRSLDDFAKKFTRLIDNGEVHKPMDGPIPQPAE